MSLRALIAGGGNMGLAYAKAWAALNQNIQITIVEKIQERRDDLRRHTGFVVEDSFGDIARADVVLLAVKPQDFPAIAEPLSQIPSEALVISILAGITLASLREALPGTPNIVRAMPNMPVQVGAGTTVYASVESMTPKAMELCRRLLEATGLSLQVAHESLLDPATAIVGSGPAYLYYLVEQFTAAAEQFGFSEEESAALVLSTWEGAIKMLRETGAPPGRLREMVTSKGGTTAAALDTFAEAGLAGAFLSGIRAAAARAKALGESK